MKTTRTILFYFLSCLSVTGFGQIQPMGFSQGIAIPRSNRFYIDYRPKLQILNDTLYVSSNSGVHRKDLKQDSGWELHAFENIPITEFVKNGTHLLAISTGSKDGKDSLLFISRDNGQTHENHFTPHLFEFEEYNYPYRLVQNPENPASLLLFHACYGLSKSEDFGNSWKNLNAVCGGYQDWFAGFHPLDTTTLFYSGELPYFAGYIYRSVDNGETWPAYYTHPNNDNCIHHIAFHPTDPDILVYSGELALAKSTDKGNSWNVTDLEDSGLYFYKVLFDEENPRYLYASGINRKGNAANDTVYVYRSTDTGENWHLAYKEKMDTDCGGVYDMLKYKNKLIFYTRDSGIFELNLDTSPTVSIEVPSVTNGLRVYLNPVQDALYFETEKAVNRVEIIDANGRTIRQVNLTVNSKKIHIPPLQRGIYLAVFHSGPQKITRKIRISD